MERTFSSVALVCLHYSVKLCFCTRHGFEKFGVAHLSLPDVRQCVLHPLGPPQEIKHAQVVAHTLPSKDLMQTRVIEGR